MAEGLVLAIRLPQYDQTMQQKQRLCCLYPVLLIGCAASGRAAVPVCAMMGPPVAMGYAL